MGVGVVACTPSFFGQARPLVAKRRKSTIVFRGLFLSNQILSTDPRLEDNVNPGAARDGGGDVALKIYHVYSLLLNSFSSFKINE